MIPSVTAGEKLTPKQQRLLAALIEEPSTIPEAAKQANMSRVTAWRISKDPVFKEALKEATDNLTREAQRQFLSMKNAATKEHLAIINDPNTPPGVKIRAIALLYDSIIRMASLFANIDKDTGQDSIGDDWVVAEGATDGDTDTGEADDNNPDD